MHATKDRVESDTSTVCLLNILVRVHNHYTRWTLVWWILVGLRCNRTPSYCARSYTEVLPAGCWNDASRPQFRKIKCPKVLINRRFKIPHLIEGGKRIDISMWYSLFYFSWERTAKSIQTVQWRIRREQSACGTDTEKKKCGREAAELIPFAYWAQSSAVFPGQIKDLGLLLLRYLKNIFFFFYMNRKIDLSVYPIRFRVWYLKKNRFHSTFDSKNCA